MKKRILIILIVGFITSCNSQEKTSDFNIVGKWKSEDYSGYGYFYFTESGFAGFEFEKVKMDSIFSRNGENYNLTYKINYNSKPINLDLLIQNIKRKKGMKMLGMIKILNNNEILFARGEGNKERPLNFLGEETIKFKRVE